MIFCLAALLPHKKTRLYLICCSGQNLSGFVVTHTTHANTHANICAWSRDVNSIVLAREGLGIVWLSPDYPHGKKANYLQRLWTVRSILCTHASWIFMVTWPISILFVFITQSAFRDGAVQALNVRVLKWTRNGSQIFSWTTLVLSHMW